MPNGRTHTLINTIVVSSVTAVAERLGVPLGDPVVVAFLAGTVIGTVFITPDLDMARVRTDARRAWGPFELLWWPLLKVSRHRGVSHTYLRGPLIRIVYLAFMLGLFFLSVRVGWRLTGLPWTVGNWSRSLPGG
ncbi:DUF2227 family putative metal-binding protein [Deinococcus sp. YIM 134068]|uniref:DUF2227 family putative metal-binding protein n=1 Tax=Deinococcus lichenicola TaxID=3118910 RepID=UPI002F94BFE9